MIEDFKEFDKMQKEKNDLSLKEARLREALTMARKHVQELEQERLDTMAQQRSRWGIGRLTSESQRPPNSSSPNASFLSGHSQDDNGAFTITPGQTDTYGRARSNRGCAIT
uniref:Uncharacterized protein n=1 Tax=Karlodinium veneficum TaxID=407301 RepID=E8Z744_KARVE|nr:unknown [Karlodinium veneficum]